MKLTRLLLPLLLVLPLAAAGPFIEKPYLQLGADGASRGSLDLLWHAADNDSVWSVEIQKGGGPWTAMAPPVWRRVAVASVAPHRVYTATLTPLTPGERFTYRVKVGGRPAFQARAAARKGPGQGQRVAILGDLARGGPDPKAIACRLVHERPDLVVTTGDMVYQDGRISEYRENFFPVYNADALDPRKGAPLLRSTLMVGVVGNHDVGERGPSHRFSTEPDSLAYYLYWDQPLNGPSALQAPPMVPAARWSWRPFLDAAGNRFPVMGTFSFRSGDAHFTVLDSNIHVRWNTPQLREWLEKDLAGARDATWRFVVFHHPPFSGNRDYQEMWMGQLWPIFMKYGVDVVFTGHVHTYQRTRPLRFSPAPRAVAALDPATQQGELQGELEWDTVWDGKAESRPDGIIHIVTGAGGANLHFKGKAVKQSRIRPFLDNYVLDTHSFSLLDIHGGRLDFRQVGVDGAVLDQFTLVKGPSQ